MSNWRRRLERAVEYAAPVVGGLAAGPLGAGAGTVAATTLRAATSRGNLSDRLRAAQPVALAGAGATAASAALNLVAGQSLGASGLSSIGRVAGLMGLGGAVKPPGGPVSALAVSHAGQVGNVLRSIGPVTSLLAPGIIPRSDATVGAPIGTPINLSRPIRGRGSVVAVPPVLATSVYRAGGGDPTPGGIYPGGGESTPKADSYQKGGGLGAGGLLAGVVGLLALMILWK